MNQAVEAACFENELT